MLGIDCRLSGVGLLIAMAVWLLRGSADAAQTVHLTLTVDGNAIEGESTIISLGRENTIECSSFSYSISTPRESATGALTGRRQHRPVKIIKRIDKSDPLLFKALALEEPVTEAVFRHYRPGAAGGAEEQFLTITLAGGFVSGYRLLSEDAVMGGPSAPPTMSEVEFVFQDFTITYESTGATHTDTWAP